MTMTRKQLTHLALCGLVAGGVLQGAWAQPVYRIIGPDGRVTFTDRPPTEASTEVRTAVTGNPSNAAADASWPAALRQAAQRYPATLYTDAVCAPCDAARSYLHERGIPFAERTVSSNADIDALRRLSGDAQLPVLALGSEQLRGFERSEWARYLDAAGYPAQSQLPADYQRSAATPLVPVAQERRQPPANGSDGAKAANPHEENAPQPTPANPAGIVF